MHFRLICGLIGVWVGGLVGRCVGLCLDVWIGVWMIVVMVVMVDVWRLDRHMDESGCATAPNGSSAGMRRKSQK